MSLGNFLKSRQKKVAFAAQEDEDEDDNDEAMEEEIDFDTYKRQFEAELAEKIRLERQQDDEISERILAKAKGAKYKIEQDNQIIS